MKYALRCLIKAMHGTLMKVKKSRNKNVKYHVNTVLLVYLT